ncbi:hypothetical protein ABIA32_006693, partial [Streptacidiphilus sp. MAP12-20]|uniref:polymorphic toxin-type HINT domain-containing protein n=1 Tax=Streptacidiphilus sp. MAP12-20 TaxID=3156299 RepID=UPI0035177E7C
GGYTYAGDNPSTSSDPSGLMQYCLDMCAGEAGSGGGGAASTVTSSGDSTPQNSGEHLLTTVGDAVSQTLDSAGKDHFWYSWWASFSEAHLHATHGEFQHIDDQAVLIASALVDPATGETIFESALGLVKSGGRGLKQLFRTGGDAATSTSAATAALDNAATSESLLADEADMVAAKRANNEAVAKARASSAKTTTPDTPATGTKTTPAPKDDGSTTDTSGCTGCKCSFSPDTQVLLANGKTTAIGALKPGDEVESADPTTGKDRGGRKVQHVWINHDADLLNVAVNDGRGHTSVIRTTANHPFWDDTSHTWLRADHLKAGHKLASTHGQHPTVVNINATPGAAYRWNLTVQQLHTYYVMAGSVPILVHNTKGCEADPTWGGSVQFAGPDALGRPQGMSAAVSRPMIGEGTPADAGIRPPGFTGGRPIGDQARGHLLGRQLGGSGDIPENLVTLLQNPVNTPIMSGFERQVRLAVEGGQFVQYSVTPIYEGSDLVPRAVTLSAYGNGDFSLNVTILNGR